MTDSYSLVPEEQYSPDSAYGRFLSSYEMGGASTRGYGQARWEPGGYPDNDPFGVSSTDIARSGVRPLTSNEIGGLTLDDGRWVSRADLMRTDTGRRLVETEENIRRGLKRGFWDAFRETSWTDFVPFVGMLAKVGGSYSDAKVASDFYRKQSEGVETTQDEAIAATLYRQENHLASEGTWGYTFGNIVRQAPAFFMEFGMLGKAGQAVRSTAVKNIVKESSEEAAKSAATFATTRFVKTGADELAESAVRSYAEAVMKADPAKTFAQAVKELAENEAVMEKTVGSVAELTSSLMDNAANAVAGVSTWAPGLQAKTSQILARNSLKEAVRRMSADSVVQRAWIGTTQSVRKAVAEGLIDLGSWGTDAATSINTGIASSKKAALDAMTQLTFGALARGTSLYLPKEAVTRTISAAVDGKNANALALESAAWQNEDQDLMDKSEIYGAFLDLLEYVSENTGRGFNSMGRAIGLSVAPGLMKPSAKVAGLTHIVSADIERNAAGKATNVVYNGLVESARSAEAGGKFRQFLEKMFGQRSLRENVQNDKFKAAKFVLRGINVGDDVALQKTLDTGVIQPGLSKEAADAIGGDVRKFVKDAVARANKEGLEGLKYHAFQTYWIADFLTRHNIDAIAAGDMFRTMGYDGIIGEMMEERYSDFVSALFGLDARKDHGVWNNLRRAVKAAFAFEEQSDGSTVWKWDQLTAEAAAFAVPLVARAGTMRAIAALGGPNAFEKFKSDASLYADATRYGNVANMRSGEYLASLDAQKARFDTMAKKAQDRYDEQVTARQAPEGKEPRVVLDENSMNGLLDTVRRANEASRRLGDVRKHFMESVTDTTGLYTVPVITDEEFLAPAESYNLMLKTKESQANLRTSMSAYQRLVQDAPEMFQTLAKMEDRDRVNEDAGWFRRASHWVVEHAVRLGGFAVTGDVSFLSVNPARFSAVDMGLPGDVLTRGQHLYQRALRQRLSEQQESKAADAVEGRGSVSASQADFDAAHAKALEDIREESQALMMTALAVHQARMFSGDEIRDIAMKDVAEQDGYATDASSRKFVNEKGEEVSFDDYLSRAPEGQKSVLQRIDDLAATYTQQLYYALTSGEGAHRVVETSKDGAVRSVQDILTVPKNLPTANQAIVAKIARGLPQLRSVMLAKEVDGSKALDDQFNEVAVDRKWMDMITDAVLPLGSPEITADTDMEKVYSRISTVHPGILATVARGLNIRDDGTRKSIEARNRSIARIAVMMSVSTDRDLKTFVRMTTEQERKSRFTSPFGVSSPARFNGREWVSRIVDRDSSVERVIRAATAEELVQKMTDAGYSETNPKTVFTSVKMLQSDDALDMIRVLGLGTEYERRMTAVSDTSKHDPLLRKDDDGNDEFSNEDEADAQREREKVLADMYDSRKSADPSLYLRAGEKLSDSNGKLTPEGKRAAALASSCKEAWFRRNGRSEDGKTAFGYVAVAEDLLRDYGVTVPFSSSDNVYGVASQGRRGKYTISIRTVQARGLSRNVYVPIDHENSQNYESALLEASLFTEYAKHRIYISDVYRSQVQAFMDHVSDVCAKVSTSYRAEGNDRTADLIDRFRAGSVARPDGRPRLPSPQTFAQFVSAFNLFRTEVPGVWRPSVLGQHAEALCAIARDVRQGTAYLGWTAVVDRILGGTGLEVSALNGEPPKTGLGRYYALWAPRGSKTLDKAIEDAVPGGMPFSEFADRATRQAQATAQSVYENSRRKAKSEHAEEFVDEATEEPSDETREEDLYVPPVMPTAPGPMAPLHVAQQIAIAGDLDIEDTLDIVADSAGEVRASELGGDTVKPEDRTASAESDDSGDWEEGEVSAFIDDDMSMDRPDDYFDVTDVGTVASTAQKDHLSLSPSETKAAVQTFVKMAVTTLGIDSADQLTPPAFRDFLENKVAVNKRKADLKNLVDVFRDMRKTGGLSTDVSWSLNDVPDTDEEGILPDGAEGNAQRSVEILKSKALTNWLAMFSLVSPQTGRDFQPLVEDLRSLLRAAPSVMPDRSSDLVEADEFLNGIVNPRGDHTVDNAPARDTIWRHRMSWFEQASGHRKDIVRYIKAYLGNAGEPPVNARAALLLSYLLNIADRETTDHATGQRRTVYDSAINVRMALASLIGSSAAAQPVKLSKTEGFGVDGNFSFMLAPRRRRGGYNNLESVVSAFSRLSGKTGEELVKVADGLEKSFKEHVTDLTKRQMFGGRTGSSFSTWASILTPVFGFDSPIVSVFLSRPMYGTLFGDARTSDVLRGGFSSLKYDRNGQENYGGIPFAAFQLVDSIRRLGREAGVKPPTYEQINAKAVELFQSGAPSTRSMANMETTLQGQSVWMSLFRAYADARPVSVMTAEVDPERTSKPASSLAITMPGIEPALLEFMDRKDDRGYASVLRKWFPDRFEKLSDDEASRRIADWRQRMIWPDSSASLIVAKSVSKSALASEVLNGCETSYDRGNEQNMVYVPVYSGDHSSSIIVQVPLLSQFKDAGMSYDDVAEMVSSWVGLDLLGTDAKRSAVTCLEAPGTSMWDYEYDDNGNVVTKGKLRVTRYSGRWSRSEVEDDKNRLYLFGDNTDDRLNTKHVPSATQAVIRGLPNALGIDTKKNRGTTDGSYFTDADFDTFKARVDEVMKAARDFAGEVVIPADGIGTGKAELPTRAPKCFAYLQEALDKLESDAREQSEPNRGHAYVSIVWNSDPEANNEALIGTSGIFGYGAERQKELAKDPKSSTLKVHIAATAEDEVYGPLLTLIKSLAVAPSKEGGRGQFLACAPMGFISDHAWSLIKGQENRSTVSITDWDSIKLSQANSKTIGADNGSGKPVALMKYVFAKLDAALKAGGYVDASGNRKEVGSEISGDELDNLVGNVEWVNLGGSGKKGTYKLSQLLAGVKIVEVKRPGDYGGHKMFSLVFEADNQMAFQVANVSHKAQADFSRTPRNYMTDACAVSRVLEGHNADMVAGTSIFKGGSRVCDDMKDLVTSWGFTGAAISSNATSIDNMLADDEEWQDAMDKMEPRNGDYALDLRQRKFASEAKKNNLAIQFFNNAVPLTTNGGWIGSDGRAHSHTSSQMFNDTLQGARTIRMSDREFMRGHKRVAIANVNNVDPWFRYGMYVDEKKLLSVFSKELEKLNSADLTSEYRRVVAVLDHVISKIVENEYSGVTGRNNAYRKLLAECLIDHRGNFFSDRYSTVTVTRKNSKTGETRKELAKRFCWETISYADLFTSATSSSSDSMEFDRTAVYESMFNDATGRNHIYLGGTMMGMPRTPSYNGSMWLQCVRAGLPVTERVESDGKQWQAGIDAMVSPDPFTLAILGCDHDGDKTNLYMIRPGKNGSFDMADLSHLTRGIDRFISDNGILNPGFRRLSPRGKQDLQRRIDKLVELGYLEYETRTEDDGEGNKITKTIGLRLSQLGKTRISNSFVSGLFDLNRMAPVSDNSEQEVSVYDGYRSNGETKGSFYHGVKAKPAPDAPGEGKSPTSSTSLERNKSTAWDLAMEEEGVLSAPLLDAKTGKIIGRPRTATAVQDGAAVVSEARAIIVSMAGALHFAYASGMKIGPFATREVSEQEWIDFMYHVDGLSNMTFDDIKEQICTRLGIRPNMIESILADIINSADSGKLPTTDGEFIRAFVKYGKSVNDGKSSRHWMARASDPADYRFQAEFDKLVPGYFDRKPSGPAVTFGVVGDTFDLELDDYFAEDTVARKLQKWCQDYVASGVTDDQAANRWADASHILTSMMSATGSVKDPLNGFTYWVQNVAEEAELDEAFSDIAAWMDTVDQLDEAKRYGNAVNYAHVDPASNTAAAEAVRLARGFRNTVTSRFVPASDPRSDEELRKRGLQRVPDSVYNRSARMRAATAMMYDDSIGLVVAARGIRAATEFSSNLATEITNYGREAVRPDVTTRRALGVAAFASASRVSSSDTLACQSNMQSVPWTAAAITTCPPVTGSTINSRNLYDVMEYMGRIMSYARSGDTKVVNTSLATRYTVEAMTDLVARLVLNSSVHQQLNIFDFIKEVPDANAFGYMPDRYGPAAKGLSRITPAFQHITEAQRSDVCAKYDRVTIGRELDSDSSLIRDGWKSARGDWTERHMNFTLSTENLMRIYEYLDRQPVVKASMKVSSQKEADRLARSLTEGNRRDIIKTVKQLIFVFSGKELDQETGKFVAKRGNIGLEARFGKGFKIEPSALFAQILPAYACSTALVTGPAGTDSNSLLSIMPDRVYGRLAAEVARVHNNPALNRWSDMAASLRYAPFAVDVGAQPVKTVKPAKQFVADFQLAEDRLHAHAENALIAKTGDERNAAIANFITEARAAARKESPYSGVPEDPRAHHTLCIYDGVRGVAFRSMLSAMDGTLGVDRVGRKTDPKRTPVTEAPATVSVDQTVQQAQPTPATPASATVPAPVEPGKVPDEVTQDIADRMSALLKMWDKGRVEYNGGTSFVIHGNFTDAEGNTFETHVDVDLKPGESILTDEQLLSRVKNSPIYRQSLSVKSGVPEADIERMAKTDIPRLFALAKKFAPVGFSRTLRPGSADFGAAEGYVAHSGAADGSDSAWGDMSALYGAKANHYRSHDPSSIAKSLSDRYAGNRSQRIVELTDAQFREGMEHYKVAAERLGKHVTSKLNVQGLMARNWFQVKNSDAVFAISRGFDGQGILGGTGYAVQMAKDSGKPIHVFDQPTKSWYRWTGTSWQQEPTPTLTKNFAGVGTREINEDGHAAIADVFSKTFGGTVPSLLQEIGQWNLDARKIGVLTGRIVLAHDAKDANVIYHEFFHSVMGFMRSIGALSNEEIAQLNKKYGDSAKYKSAWFNEERAAEDFKKFVMTTLDPQPIDSTDQTGFWGKLKAFLDSLFDLVFGTGPEAFGNDMDKNPLAGIVLTGKVRGSEKRDVPERTDFGTRLASAVKTFVGVKSGKIAKVQQLNGLMGKYAPESGMGLVEYGDPASSYGPGIAAELASREYLILFDYLDFDVVHLLNQQGNQYLMTDFERFINGVEMLYSRSDDRAQQRADMDALEKSTPNGSLFRKALVAFTKKYGPKVVRSATNAGDSALPQVPERAVRIDAELKKEFSEDPTAYTDAMVAARHGITIEEAAGIVAQLKDVKPVFSPEEIAQIRQALGDKPLWVTSASRRTDMAFFTDRIHNILENNAKKPFTDPTRINAIEFWSKHDGLPVRKVLEDCAKYKVAPMVSFSVTTLGGTAYEPGVLKWRDLYNLISTLVKDGVLNPSTTTIRVDPMVPGVTRVEEVTEMMEKFYELGVRKFVASVTQSYGYTQGTERDRKIVQRMNRAHKKETGNPYPWSEYYGLRADGKVEFEAKESAIAPYADMFKRFQALHPDARVQSCSFAKLGLKPSACLDPYILERVVGVDIFRKDGSYDVTNPLSGRKERPDCECYGAHSDILRYDDKCRSACMYCYAAQDLSNPISYYNEDGSLISGSQKDAEFARAREEEESVLLPGDSVPNETFDSSVADFLAGATMLDAPPADVDDAMAMAPADEPEMASVHVETNNALRKIMPARMNRPYTATNSLALEIAKVVAAEFDESKIPADTLGRMTRSRGVSLSEEQDAKIRNAIRQVGSLFGVDVSDSVNVERLVFRAMCELSDLVSPDGVLQKNVNRADGGVSRKKTLITPNDLASAIFTASGVRPCDVLESTVDYVKRIAAKYPADSTFITNVVEPVLRGLEKVKMSDPANVMYDNGTSEDVFGAVLSSIRAGLDDPDLNEDGTRQPFNIRNVGTSKNPFHDDNVAAYSDHILNPDFQDLMHTVLDRLYTLQASMRWYRNIGFEPGSPEDTIAIRGVAPSFAEPLTQAETMASLSATVEQYESPYFSVTDFFDQPSFIAMHPEAWLDSVTRPNFGNTTLREAAQEEKRQIAGFHVRANQLDGIIIRALGLDVMPGDALTAIDKDYVSRFSMDAGKTRREDGSHAIKFLAYEGKKAKRADGTPITVDLNDQRRADMTYKMWKVMAQGGRSMVTGVNGLVLALSDSADPDHYTLEKVQQRSRVGLAGGYSDFDRFLLRMDWQLRKDSDAQWDDVLGKDGLNLYDRVVKAACAALQEAKRLNETVSKFGTPELLPKDVNDFVLQKLVRTGLVQAAETSFDGGRTYVRTSGVLTIPVDEWMKFWENSSTYRKLVDAGRDERTLKLRSEGSVAGELIALFNDVRRFVDAHPYLSDGDGAYFHNMSTPLPWVGGDGYAMYALNRNEREKTDLVKNVETMNEYERTFHEFVASPSLERPAHEAGDNMMRLFKVLFHTSEQSPDVIRQAMADGKYDQLRKGATQKDLALAIYDKLVSMIWRSAGDPELSAVGGPGALRRMIKEYDRRSMDGSAIAGGAGLTDEAMFRISGKVPANYQLGHAVKHAIDGITNAFMFRSTLFNMLTTPDEAGMPTCYARPSDGATEESGIPDSMWGTVARWWATTNGFDNEYDITRSGVQNAQHIYDLVARDTVNGVRKVKGTNGETVTEHYGELSNSEIDQTSVTAFMARSENPEDESSLGNYALGYAKHLFQSSRTLGTKAVTKQLHRALAWSKGLSVNFSYFFPIATRFESPSGAVGAIATFCGNVDPDWMRKHSELLRKMQDPLGKGKAGWITQDFIGQKDIMSMLDSNDPYLAELYHWAGVLGIQLSDPDVNPMEHSRSYLRSDLDRVVRHVAVSYGAKAAKNVKEIMNSILLKSGDRAFTYHLNATKLAVVAQLCTKLQAEAARHGKAFDPVRDLKRYSAYVNAEIGGIDPLQFAWAHPVMQSRMNALFFSWGWTRGAWEAGGGTALEQLLFGGHDVTPEQRRYYRGRWMRMFGEIMIGVPMVLQFASKVIGLSLVAGLNPDDDDTLTEEERRRLNMLIQKVHDSPWFTWQNEDKAWLTQYDLTPLMTGMTARFPSFSKYIGKDHPWLKTIGGLGMALAPMRLKPLFMALAAPTYEGVDGRNSTTMGRRYYQHFGKQGWEELRWFDNPFKQFLSKMSMPAQRLAEGVFGRSLTYLDHPQPWDSQGDFERWLNPSMDGATFNLLRAFVPFSISSLTDTSDAGFLSMVAPVSMGASGTDVKRRLSSYIDRWSANDRRGYAFAGATRKQGQAMGKTLARKSVTVAHLVQEAMANGYSEKDAYRLVDDVVATKVKSLYGQILRAMPDEPDGRFDAHRMAGLLRQANRLGRFRKDMFRALKKRIETQQRWGYLNEETRRRMVDILNWGRGRTAYDEDTLDSLNDKRYDY